MGCKCLPALPLVIPEALLYVISLRNNCLAHSQVQHWQSCRCQKGWLWTHRLCSFSSTLSFGLPWRRSSLGVLHELSKTLGIIGHLLLNTAFKSQKESFQQLRALHMLILEVRVLHIMSLSYQDTQSSGHWEKINHAPCSNSLIAAKTTLVIAFFSCLPLQELYQITGDVSNKLIEQIDKDTIELFPYRLVFIFFFNVYRAGNSQTLSLW